MKYAQPGDIILFYYKKKSGFWGSPLSWAISKFQQNPVTHSGVILDPWPQTIIDAYWPRVRRVRLKEILDPKAYRWIAVRPKNSTEIQRAKVCDAAISYIGAKYDLRSWISLAKALLIERYTHDHIRETCRVVDNPRKLFCQELVTQCYLDAGFDLAKEMGFKDPSAILPKDLYNNTRVFDIIETSE